ncbi:ubiquitin-like-conjugating enzyme ATG10 [Polypterus senegalus]|uniref:ubiquitin-like-conjugating enzyme ATG10 n=1 Tax=Polypterus senegalus TaxID=55291 RepID=UPI00196317B1|nr:ubiquitin-like-conjugating enzyme ATG10 [Polypterus senegalus]
MDYDSCNTDLHLGEKTFQLSCHNFIQHSKAIGDGWVWESIEGTNEGYMKKVILKMKNAFGYAIPEQQKIVNEKTYRQEFEVQKHAGFSSAQILQQSQQSFIVPH